MGYLVSGILFAALFLVPIIGLSLFRLNEITTFWIAYVLTRPLGASFADWAGVPPQRGGLDWGTGWVSLGLGAGIILAIALSTRMDAAALDLD